MGMDAKGTVELWREKVNFIFKTLYSLSLTPPPSSKWSYSASTTFELIKDWNKKKMMD